MRQVVCAGLFVAVVATSAHGQEVAEPADAEARELFEAGTVAYDAGLYEAALMHFERAYELSGRAELLYNVGLSADRARDDERALSAYRAFLEEAPDHPEHDSVANRVRAIERARISAERAAANAQDVDLSAHASRRRRRVIGGVIGAVLAVGIAVTVAVLVTRDPRFDPPQEVGDVGGVIKALRR